VKVPLILQIGVLICGTTVFYTYIGQLVPQKEVHPPAAVQLAADMKPEDLVRVGREIFDGKGLCLTCHTGKLGARCPDLQGIASRAGDRVPGMSALDYLAQSLYDPDAFVVPGFDPAMDPINKPPIDLTDQEILAVIAYLQSLGGTPTVTLSTELAFAKGAPAAAGPAAGG
jgi:mono/diheme cytochrome c family protein